MTSPACLTTSACLRFRALASALFAATLGFLFPPTAVAAEPALLWQIGKPDNDNREFALAPNRYNEFRDDGFFVVGKSEPQRDWPYVHPGPVTAGPADARTPSRSCSG